MASPADITAAGAMLLAPVSSGDWLVIAPVVIAISLGAFLLMFRHYLRWQAVIASGWRCWSWWRPMRRCSAGSSPTAR